MIWTRSTLKEQAREALNRNYWPIVLVSFLALLFCSGFFSAGSGNRHGRVAASPIVTADTETAETAAAGDDAGLQNRPENSSGISKNARNAAVTIFVLIALMVLVLFYILQVLLIFPLRVGISRFMIKSIDDTAKVREIAYGFDHSYKNVIKTMFHYDIRIFLWTLLFIIPGFYKQYQYRMVPYILAEYPDMDYREVLKKSSDMMDGHMWKAFMLDLSFILWHMGGLMTCGILEVFYAAPYQALTSAALYRTLSCPEIPARDQSLPPASLYDEVNYEI